MKRIPFNKAPVPDTAADYISDVLRSRRTSGNGKYTKLCQKWLCDRFGAEHALLTTSGSHALDMAARLCNIKSGDEVIMPSFTFSSTANAFAAVGAKIVFVDIRPDTMNIDEELIEAAISNRTRVIAPVHYAGAACEMDMIRGIAVHNDLLVVEDAAQAVMSTYKGKALGTLGRLGCYSFHSTKNYSMGEGGALLLADTQTARRAEIMWETGTNRSCFMRGEIDKYSWVDWGSSYLPSELNAAYLWSQLEIADDINDDRLKTWRRYYELLTPLAEAELLILPYVLPECGHNAHIFHIRTRSAAEQEALLAHLKSHEVGAVFHYVPLHSSLAGKKFGEFRGEDRYTTSEAAKLIRLPIYYGMAEEDTERVADLIYAYFRKGIVR
ncbi:MAG: dTDP-4-amino-4,6-dideoxygalactose transaminase [Clostridiales Family XIII bacterium]|jgi:dTDP-4-amino-4,6-dideoxygalactose transaminase|nr:dTDP-4-amino-4,6-dideoxygalactose transaminase [Clostridiales Family XIII bacterium]